MASPFQDFVATLKSKLNIVEVASAYISLDRRGTSWWACCPFHNEKTPSFSINEPEQFYHCFGCGASGDVIKFVSEMENIDFMSTVKLLAEKAGMQMPQTGADNKKTAELKRRRDSLLKIMNDAAHFYLDNLNSGKADEHIEYILKRKIPSNIVRAFGLGASLDFNSLPAYLYDRGYSRKDMLDSGAVTEANGRLIDAQGGRLIFPVINAMDEVIAFGGRALRKTEFAKYKNTRETLIFNKSKTLYNVNLLKKLKKTEAIREVIMVEGYMDAISLYGAGFKNVVASMGTSLTQEQARLVKRYTSRVLISYDGDSAGQKANLRGLDIFRSEGMNVNVVPLPDGLDPDDVIKKLGAEGYRQCLERAVPLMDYKLGILKGGYDLKRAEEKRRYIAEALKVVKTSDSAAEQEQLLKTLREDTGITYESLKRDLDSAPAEAVKAAEPQLKKKDVATALDKASRFVTASYLFGAEYARETDIEQLPIRSEVHKIIASYIRSKAMLGERLQPAEVLEFFEENTDEYDELCRILDYSDGEKLKGEVAERYFRDCVKSLKLSDVNNKIDTVTAAVSASTDTERQKQLSAELLNLIKLKEKIKSGDIK